MRLVSPTRSITMHTRTLGPFNVSAIGFGCMSMSMGYGPADDKESEILLNQSLDLGYTLLDTAAMYGMGHNETLIGKALKSRRQEYILASKCGIFKDESGKASINGRPEVLKKTCEESLRRLQTEEIDLYYYHRLDKAVPIEESVGALGDLVTAGKIRTIGLSEMSSTTLRRAHKEHPISAMQSEYSLWSRTPEFTMLKTCKELNVSFVPFSPLARQFLTGKCKDLTHYTDDDIRCTNARPRFEPEAFAQNKKLLVPYARIAERAGCTMAQLALAWLLAQDDNIIPIPGTKHCDYLVENAQAGDISLANEVIEELNELINEKTVSGRRYTDPIMDSTDSEKDREDKINT